MIMPTLHIIEGPVGAGKTTYANKLAQDIRSPPLVLDRWMVNLFQPDRPETGLWEWYSERKARCVRKIMTLAGGLLEHGHDAIVELGLVKVEDRLKLYADLEGKARSYLVHVLDADRDERRRRVMKRNIDRDETFAMHVSEAVFEMASDSWEPIDSAELQGRLERFHFVR